MLVYLKSGKSGREVEIATLKVGSFFGEIALMDSLKIRTANVKTQTYCDLHVLSSAHFHEVMELYPEMKHNFEMVASHR